MSAPASRSLEVVLRRALTPDTGALRLIVGEYDEPGADPRYANVIVDGEPLQVPKPPAESPGTAAYLLAAPGRLLALGAVPAGAAPPATFISGSGPPAAGTGADGAIYLDTVSRRVWGPKAAGAWPATALGRIVPLAPTYAQLTSG